MIERRKFADLGGADHGWLKAKHHFSFASYYDPERMGWGNLRVWNDDEIAAEFGFPPHPHADMEIITYVREGAITHQDSMGNKGRTEAGDVQVMSAGSGVRHAEYNREDETTRIFQIWIEPNERGGKPAWGAKPFPKADRSGRFVTLASGFASDTEALPIRADARVMGATVKAGERVTIISIPRGTPTLCLLPVPSRLAGCASRHATARRSRTLRKSRSSGSKTQKSSWLTRIRCREPTATAVGSSGCAWRRTCLIWSLRAGGGIWAADWRSAAFCRLRADGWLVHSFFWITWGLPTFALVKGSTFDRTRISACRP